MIPLTEIFCFIDDFCKHFESEMRKISLPNKKRNRPCRLSLSEIMTIIVIFQLSHYKTFKDFYLNCLSKTYAKDFPKLLSYNRFVELMPTVFLPLVVLLNGIRGKETGKYYIDSTKLPVCENLRISRHKVFEGCAARGKTSTGWFFGFKLHLIINDQGEIMRFCLTPGNIHDSKIVQKLSKGLKGWLFGDKGYIGKNLVESLKNQGLELITNLRKNMKERILDPLKQKYLEKRRVIETTIDQLKNILTIDHSRHRSIMNFQVNTLGALVAYAFKPKKPTARFQTLNQLSLTSN
jgi:IS5 family transposase